MLNAMGTPGLAGLDKLISYYISVELHGIQNYIEKGIREKTWINMLEECQSIIENPEYSKGSTNPGRLYSIISSHTNKIWPPMFDWILRIGHFQLLRNKMAYELNTACKFEAKHMEAALRTLNTYV